MERISTALIWLVVILHLGFLVAEMFLWTNPNFMMVLDPHNSTEKAAASAHVAANMGLYNGFLAAGLIWGLLEKPMKYPIHMFFLTFIVMAGVFGAISTMNVWILVAQALPGVAALLTVWMQRPS